MASAKERTGHLGWEPSLTFNSGLVEFQASVAAEMSTCLAFCHLQFTASDLTLCLALLWPSAVGITEQLQGHPEL